MCWGREGGRESESFPVAEATPDGDGGPVPWLRLQGPSSLSARECALARARCVWLVLVFNPPTPPPNFTTTSNSIPLACIPGTPLPDSRSALPFDLHQLILSQSPFPFAVHSLSQASHLKTIGMGLQGVLGEVDLSCFRFYSILLPIPLSSLPHSPPQQCTL
jgi:hypothetical protein